MRDDTCTGLIIADTDSHVYQRLNDIVRATEGNVRQYPSVSGR